MTVHPHFKHSLYLRSNDARIQCHRNVTHVSTPDVGLKDLVLFIKVEYLYERQSVVDLDRVGVVQDRSPHYADLLVPIKNVLD